MNPKQKLAIVTPLVLVAVMYPIFHALAGVMNDRVAWFLGLTIYWIIWGAIFPLLIIGKDAIKKLILPHKSDKKILLLIAIPLLGAVAGRFILGGYEKESVWIALLLFSTPFGNGFFEEVLWRGVCCPYCGWNHHGCLANEKLGTVPNFLPMNYSRIFYITLL